ncbi:hypothetical protein DFH28DRAFT_1119262 [Melampsora americana]|nr:hypothetical protein DFH28DRAFT_1119262 [Melampsora americana]
MLTFRLDLQETFNLLPDWIREDPTCSSASNGLAAVPNVQAVPKTGVKGFPSRSPLHLTEPERARLWFGSGHRSSRIVSGTTEGRGRLPPGRNVSFRKGRKGNNNSYEETETE